MVHRGHARRALNRSGDARGKFTTGWAEGLGSSSQNWPSGLVADRLRLDGNALRGEIYGEAHCPRLTFNIEAGVQDGRLQGTYKGIITGWSRQVMPTRTEVEGPVIGRLVAGDDLRKLNALAPGRDYPCHRGPFGGGAAVDCGQELVQSFADARLVWKSEENFVPGAWGSGAWGHRDSNYGGVAVAEGRVYAYYTSQVLVPDEAATRRPAASAPGPREEPASNPHVMWTEDARGISILTEVNPDAGPRSGWTPSDPYRGPLRRKKALDRVLCLDAATGRTLWRASWPGLSFVLKDSNHTTPCIADGTMVVQSGIFMIYALDAATGAMRWSNAHTFRSTKSFERRRSRGRQRTKRLIPVDLTGTAKDSGCRPVRIHSSCPSCSSW